MHKCRRSGLTGGARHRPGECGWNGEVVEVFAFTGPPCQGRDNGPWGPR